MFVIIFPKSLFFLLSFFFLLLVQFVDDLTGSSIFMTMILDKIYNLLFEESLSQHTQKCFLVSKPLFLYFWNVGLYFFLWFFSNTTHVLNKFDQNTSFTTRSRETLQWCIFFYRNQRTTQLFLLFRSSHDNVWKWKAMIVKKKVKKNKRYAN